MSLGNKASDAVTKLVMGNLVDIKSDFYNMRTENPSKSFPECLELYEQQHGVRLNGIQRNNALNGFESAARDLS